MTNKISIKKNFISFGIPLVLFFVLIFLMKSSSINLSDKLSFAITVDLLLSVPLVYFLLIRKTQISKTTVIPVMFIGLLIGSYFMPKEDQTYLFFFKTWIFPIIEVSVFTFLIIKVRDKIKNFRESEGSAPDFYTILKSTCYEILPKRVVMIIVTEIAVFYYSFISWKTKPLLENEFSYHKQSGTQALFGAFILIIIIETIAFHFLLALWSIVLAWVLTILSIYTTVQVFGFAKSLSKRPILLNNNSLTLKYGILNETEISFLDIEKIEISNRLPIKDLSLAMLSPIAKFENHNVLIYLNNENEIVNLYGMKKKFKVIGVFFDEPKKFKDKIDIMLNGLNSEAY